MANPYESPEHGGGKPEPTAQPRWLPSLAHFLLLGLCLLLLIARALFR